MRQEISYGQKNQWLAEQMKADTHSVRNPKNRLAVGLLVPLVLAACGSSPAAAPVPSASRPPESPAPVTVKASPLPSPSIRVEVTMSPPVEPTPTLIVPYGVESPLETVDHLITTSSEHPKDITAGDLGGEIAKLYEDYPQAASVYPEKTMNNILTWSQTGGEGTNGDPSAIIANRKTYAEYLVEGFLFISIKAEIQGENALSQSSLGLAADSYRYGVYTLQPLDPTFQPTMNVDLRTNFPKTKF